MHGMVKEVGLRSIAPYTPPPFTPTHGSPVSVVFGALVTPRHPSILYMFRCQFVLRHCALRFWAT